MKQNIPQANTSPYPLTASEIKISNEKMHGSVTEIMWGDWIVLRHDKEKQSMYQTQKARGVSFIYDNTYAATGHPSFDRLVEGPPGPKIILPQDGIPDNFHPSWPMFARPCPLTPKHGFVESGKVYGWTSVFEKFGAAKLADKDAELILMPALRGRYSGVATNAGVTYGFGHDGATGIGIGAVNIPTPCDITAWKSRWPTRVSIHTNPYLEIVEHDGKACLVQVRDGPLQEGTVNYIPRRFKPKHVETGIIHYDLLEWEKHVKTLYAKYGKDVVFIMRGTALSSHYAVHVIQHGMAVITDATTEAVKGKFLDPSKDGPKPLTEQDYKDLRQAVKYWTNIQLPISRNDRRLQVDFLLSAIASIHASPAWGNDRVLLNFRAMAAVMLARFLTAGCVGEARYFFGSGPGRESENRPAVDWEGLFGKEDDDFKSNRELIYHSVLNLELSELEELAKGAEIDFKAEGASIGWRGNMGGRPWAKSAGTAKDLLHSLQVFIEEPTEEHWVDVFSNANLSLNAAHNNGRVLDKWVASDIFGTLSLCPAWGFLNNVSANMALKQQYYPRFNKLRVKRGGE